MTAGGLDALAARHDYRQSTVGEFIEEKGLHLFESARQRVDRVEMCGIDAEAEADLLDFAGTLGVLSSGHAGGQEER